MVSAVSLELLVPAIICFLLLVAANVLQARIKVEGHPWHTWLRALRIAKYVLTWYIISISFTLCNKWVLRYWHGDGFPFPVFVTSVHMTTKFCLTRFLNRWCTPVEKRVRPLPWRTYVRGPVPIGVCTAVDVAFSNLSFLFISVTFYTILKSGAILWVLVWATLMRLEPLTWEIVAICALVSTGVSLASYGEASFSWVGFILVTAACASSGLRWALTQIMLEGKGGGGESSHRPSLVNQDHVDGEDGHGHDHSSNVVSSTTLTGESGHRRRLNSSSSSSSSSSSGRRAHLGPSVELQDPVLDASDLSSSAAAMARPSPLAVPPPPIHHPRPFEILYYVTPASALSCVTVFVLVELQSCVASPVFQDPALLCQLLTILLMGGMISFLLVLSEVKLVKISSSLTMSMFGAVKEIITVAISMIVFHDDVSFLNISGLLIAILGAVWYRQYKQKPSSSLMVSSGASVASAGGGSVVSEYLPGEGGLFNLESDSSDEDGEGGDGREEEVEIEMYGGPIVGNNSRAQLA